MTDESTGPNWQLSSATDCPAPGCTGIVISPLSLYCSRDEHLLLLADRPFWQQAVALNLARASLAGLVLVAAHLRSAVPLYVIAAALGAILLGFQLRPSRLLQLIAVSGWLAALTLAALVLEGALDPAILDVLIALGAVALTLALSAVTVIAAARAAEPKGLAPSTARSVALGFTLGPGILALTPVLGIDGEARDIAVALGLAAIVGVVGMAGGVGLLHAVSATPPPHVPRFAVGAPLTPPGAWPGGFALGALWQAADLVVRGTARLANALEAALHWAVLTIGAAARNAFALLRASAAATRRGLEVSARFLLASLAIAALAAIAAATAGRAFLDYLSSGRLATGIAAFALAGVALATLALGPWALTASTLGEVRDVARRTSTRVSGHVFLTLLAIAWLNGILGWLELGPIEPGALTIMATVALALSLIPLLQARHRAAREAR